LYCATYLLLFNYKIIGADTFPKQQIPAEPNYSSSHRWDGLFFLADLKTCRFRSGAAGGGRSDEGFELFEYKKTILDWAHFKKYLTPKYFTPATWQKIYMQVSRIRQKISGEQL
jgi:hypothetical protein